MKKILCILIAFVLVIPVFSVNVFSQGVILKEWEEYDNYFNYGETDGKSFGYAIDRLGFYVTEDFVSSGRYKVTPEMFPEIEDTIEYIVREAGRNRYYTMHFKTDDESQLTETDIDRYVETIAYVNTIWFVESAIPGYKCVEFGEVKRPFEIPEDSDAGLLIVTMFREFSSENVTPCYFNNSLDSCYVEKVLLVNKSQINKPDFHAVVVLQIDADTVEETAHIAEMILDIPSVMSVELNCRYSYLSANGSTSGAGSYFANREVVSHVPSDDFTIDLQPADNVMGKRTVCCAACGASFAEDVQLLTGDANGDGDVNMKDVLLMRRSISGLYDENAVCTNNADVDGDEEITMKDVIVIRRIIGGLT